jgi:ribosomal protein L11
MKDDLIRLLKEFLEETRDYRTEKIDVQLTDKMPKKYEDKLREPTLYDLINWLNGDIE